MILVKKNGRNYSMYNEKQKEMVEKLIESSISFNKKLKPQWKANKEFIRSELQSMEWILEYEDTQPIFDEMCERFNVRDD